MANEPDDLRAALTPYVDLLRALASGNIASGAFQEAFFALYLEDERELSERVFDILDGFFADVDSFVDDPALRAQVRGAIGSDELRERATNLLTLAAYA